VYRAEVASDGPPAAPVEPSGGPPPEACGSCSVGGDALLPVHRVYLAADAAGALRVTQVLADTEWWCPACRAQYPNEPADG